MVRRPLVPATLVMLASVSLLGTAPPAPGHSIPDRRVADLRALEEVRWRHRIWPSENPGPKPPLNDVLSEAALRARIEDDARRETALSRVWGRSITPSMVQAELDRMVENTRDPIMLREMFEALGGDAARIAETVARPALVTRLLHRLYARDQTLHAGVKRRAEAALGQASASSSVAPAGSERAEVVYVLERSSTESPGAARAEEENAVALAPEAWADLRQLLQRQTTGAGGLIDEDDRFVALVPRRIEADRIEVITFAWRKEPFDSWWAGRRGDFAPAAPAVEARYTVGEIAATTCIDDSWAEVHRALPQARAGAVMVWTGSEMLVWGGMGNARTLNTGDRYDPATDAWSKMRSDATAPAARLTVGVWTGTELIVWGGSPDGTIALPLASGGRYNPSTDTWTATRLDATTPAGRSQHTAVWTGSEMIVWGGVLDGNGTVTATGGRYRPATNTWTATLVDATTPVARRSHAAVWTGSEMIVWGGRPDGTGQSYSTGGRYAPASNTWTATSTVNAPGPRGKHTLVWSGTEAIVWGGTLYAPGPQFPIVQPLNTGGRYNPALNQWTATRADATTPPVMPHPAGMWTGTDMIVFGGPAGGWRYNPVADAWTALPSYPASFGPVPYSAIWTGQQLIALGGDLGFPDFAIYPDNRGGRLDPVTGVWSPLPRDATPSARSGHTAVWTGSEMIVWGGDNFEGQTNDGARYDPALDDWSPMRLDASTPSPRFQHTAVWTGAELIIWGGESDASPYQQSGGRYNPATDQWLPTPVDSETPPGRFRHTAVWSGTEMIVWGGFGSSGTLNSGGRYSPAHDLWKVTRADGSAPAARAGHTAVWARDRMIVWGGQTVGVAKTNTGGLYDPLTDRWSPTRDDASAPAARDQHIALWTGVEMILWGGSLNTAPTFTNDGGRYRPGTDTWTAIPSVPASPEPRTGHASAWNGAELIVWGGASASTGGPISTGGRYDVLHGTWRPTRNDATTPPKLNGATAVWTGGQMIVWGGTTLPNLSGVGDAGGRYCAAVPDFTDSDGDGVPDASDCAPLDPTASDVPQIEVQGLMISGGASATLTWDAPAGAPANTTYDLLDGDLPLLHLDGSMIRMSCLASALPLAPYTDSSGLSVDDGNYYLVRSRNACGAGPVGSSSSGDPRPAPACP